MDSQALVRLFDFIQRVRHPIRSVLVARHGYPVLEAYAPSVGPDVRQPIYSCTKSVTSALVGIALDNGYLASVRDRVLDFFPGRPFANPDPRKHSITLEHLLTMTPGVGWSEMVAFDSRNTLIQMEWTADWVQFFLDRPMVNDPGAAWAYNSGAVHVLSAIVQQKSGQTLTALAQENLFAPVGITGVQWPADSQGVSYGHRGIYMTAPDMARFGYLYLRGGEWDGRRVVPAQWVQASAQRRVGAMFGQGYAYLWWVPAFGGYSANGYEGQRICVIPKQDLVIAITAAIADMGMMSVPEELVSQFILPAVKSAEPLPENQAGLAQLMDQVRAFGRLS